MKIGEEEAGEFIPKEGKESGSSEKYQLTHKEAPPEVQIFLERMNASNIQLNKLDPSVRSYIMNCFGIIRHAYPKMEILTSAHLKGGEQQKKNAEITRKKVFKILETLVKQGEKLPIKRTQLHSEVVKHWKECPKAETLFNIQKQFLADKTRKA